ncbi:putative SNF5-component of SWI SNF transcription activator complex [Rosellinia necatrix]|uniref:Putative SNF5-component of SWI SNF transcription activator complex n=1 Tax=Rosellinia necatrix TaxID=77044 RepID=A0A1W2TJC9_ROSNE|nr:putative SNF5-component of SWI SNF transcription activator complex [Rosellinia necatrix]
MMTSRRPRDVAGGSFASRRGHANKLSISDTSHHITETIGTMYGADDDYQANESRPMSFIAAPRGGEQLSDRREPDLSPAEEHRLKLVRSTSGETGSLNGNLPARIQTQLAPIQSQRSLSRTNSNGGSTSPVSPGGSMSPTLRDMRDGPESYPLTNIDNPNDIAQELSNLQALRRMSMDVSNNSDPDLLPFQGMSLMAMPSIAPKGDDDADPSRLLWVPAGVHPELAPSEFKNFVEKRVQSMRRRSSETSLSPDSLERGDSGSLRRKKSMLSRQIDNGGNHGINGYVDGAERLERKRSQARSDHGIPELSLDELMKDPGKAVRKLTLESHAGAEDLSNVGDMPILPVAPGSGLRRSTRTTYRKGGSLKNRQSSLKNNERLPFSQRIAAKMGDGGEEVLSRPESPLGAPPGHGLVRVQSEPVPENFSRPSKSVRRQQAFDTDSIDISERTIQSDSRERGQAQPVRPPGPKRTVSSEHTRSLATTPQIVQTPPIEEEAEGESGGHDVNRPFPERSSSQRSALHNVSRQQSAPPSEPPSRSNKRPTYAQAEQAPPQHHANANTQIKRAPNAPDQSFDDPAQISPSLAPGSASRTDTLTFIPTFSAPEEKKSEKRGKKDSSDSVPSRSTSWKWFRGEDKEKKKKEEETKRSKAKAFVEKAHDNVRLDVLQTSIDTALQKGRESLLLERDSIDSKLEEERRKESSRKSGEHKKEKDGLFSSFFSSSKKKGDRDSSSRKSHLHRPLSPEPAPYRPLRPDVDYHWTRFPILEERAIYRMAHIKLANPRRALYSQVLLSNFMYSYLAKVQAMHPQIQVPQSPQQKRLQEEERRRREQEQQFMEQQQAQDSIDRYNFEYHREANQYSDPSMQHEAGDYPEAAEIYDYDHGKDDVQDGAYVDNYSGGKDYYSYGNQNEQRHDKEEEMW